MLDRVRPAVRVPCYCQACRVDRVRAACCSGVLGRVGACWGMMGGNRAPAVRAGPGPNVGVLGRVGWAPVRVSNCVFVRVGKCVLGVPCRAGSAPACFNSFTTIEAARLTI